MSLRYLWVISLLFSFDTSAITIIEPSHPQASQWGYDNCNCETNGEKLILDILQPGGVVFDVGANIGEWSIMALQKEPTVKLYSFEPIPAVFRQLVRNVRSAFLYDCALSDEVGTATFYVLDGATGLSGLFRRRCLETLKYKKIEVSTETIDHFCLTNHIDTIDFLKIDTEGGEWKVLQGAKDMLLNHRIKHLQFEYGGTYPDANITLKGVMQFLTQAGYKIFRISSFGIIRIAEWHDSLENNRYSNYYATILE